MTTAASNKTPSSTSNYLKKKEERQSCLQFFALITARFLRDAKSSYDATCRFATQKSRMEDRRRQKRSEGGEIRRNLGEVMDEYKVYGP